WTVYRPVHRSGAILPFYASDSHLLSLIPSEYVPALHPTIGPHTIRQELVGQAIWKLNPTGPSQGGGAPTDGSPGGVVPIPGGEAADCKDKVIAWATLGGVIATAAAGGAWVGATGDKGGQAAGDFANALQIAGGVAALVGTFVAAYGCKDQQPQSQ